MKLILRVILIYTSLHFTNCTKNDTHKPNQFSSSNDTLVIRTKKQKGEGLFSLGAQPIEFRKKADTFPYSITYPKQLLDAERFLLEPDFKEKRHYYVDIIKGTRAGQNVFSLDENNNKNLKDDTIRLVEKMKWDSTQKLIKCKYQIYNGEKTIIDSSWLKIGLVNNKLFIGRSEHLIGDFSVDFIDYKIGIIEYRNASSFTYGIDSEIALFSQNNKRKDSINKRDMRKMGEFINLDGSYYKFYSISNNGELVTLIKEKNAKSKIGTQVGMIAPLFTVVTTKGDTLKSQDLNNKVTIIANSCGCGGDKESTKAYYDIKNQFKNINLLHVDSNIDTKKKGLHIDMKNTFNTDFYNKYRMQYCSRICYIIGMDNRIIDKFIITDWKNNLPRVLKINYNDP